MYDSSISAAEIIEDLYDEVDIAEEIPYKLYVLWLNSLEQMIYSEIIREQHKITVSDGSFGTENVIKLDDIEVCDGNDTLRFDDIYTMYAVNDGVKKQLLKTTLTSGDVFPDTYYKFNDNLGFHVFSAPSAVEIIYFARPKLKTIDENQKAVGNVMLPVEFIDLAKAKLRAEAYKIANEDSLAAKWVNDYNVLLETFKSWVQNKAPQFGM